MPKTSTRSIHPSTAPSPPPEMKAEITQAVLPAVPASQAAPPPACPVGRAVCPLACLADRMDDPPATPVAIPVTCVPDDPGRILS